MKEEILDITKKLYHNHLLLKQQQTCYWIYLLLVGEAKSQIANVKRLNLQEMLMLILIPYVEDVVRQFNCY